MNTKNEKKSFFERAGVQSVAASLLCIILGLLIGYLVLLCINPAGAGKVGAASYVYAVDSVCLQGGAF